LFTHIVLFTPCPLTDIAKPIKTHQIKAVEKQFSRADSACHRLGAAATNDQDRSGVVSRLENLGGGGQQAKQRRRSFF
jgi:hypothetical protein